MNEMLKLHEEGALDAAQEAWFKAPKAIEELYDVENDPNEINNLANDPKYADKLVELRFALKTWLSEVGDMSYIPEKEMVYNWWGDKETAPTTATPQVITTSGGVKITCATKGASIGYKILGEGQVDTKVKRKIETWDAPYVFGKVKNGVEIEVATPWNVYKDGDVLNLKKGEKLLVNSMRIGYNASTIEFVQQ